MREIKFRLWCLNNNEWEKDPWFITNDGNIIDFNRLKKLSKDTHIIMQYTGLKDKDGKEIYEGDIVQNIGESKTYIMGFEYGCFDVINYDNYGHDQMRAIEDCNEWFIVGNIYENPELLKESK